MCANEVAPALSVGNKYLIECFRDGKLLWAEEVHNTVVDEGLNDVLNKYLKGSSYTAAFYVGLKGAGTIAAGDTMASHAGWTEVTGYSEGARPALTLGTVAAKSVDNLASKAVFTANGSSTVAGAFVTTNSTKGGSTGTLYGAADFSGSRSLISGDVLNVTVTCTSASA